MLFSLEPFKSLKEKNKSACRTDDWVDRMNHLYTAILLLVLGLVITTKTWTTSDKIRCWIPPEFEKEWFAPYVNDYCWISDTYRIPMMESIPENIQERQDAEITYYQWVPLILVLQACFFHLPNFLWNILNLYSGLNLKDLQNQAEDSQSKDKNVREAVIDNMASVIKRWIFVSRPYRKNSRIDQARSKMAQAFCFYSSKRQGTFITGLYLSIKMLYLVNVIGQFFLLNAFMGSGFNLYGYEYIHALSTGSIIKESPRFPRVTLCDFEIRQMQNVKRYSVQCVLPINLFNEKVFLFMWFWFVFIALITCFSFIKWVYMVMSRRYAYQYVKKYLYLNDPEAFTAIDKKRLRVFAERYLRKDGCYVTWMIGHNSTDLVVIDLLVKLWKDYQESCQQDTNTGFTSSRTHLKYT